MNRNKAYSKAPPVVRKFKNACDDLAELVNEQLFDGCRKWYWIGDEVVAEPMPQNKYVEIGKEKWWTDFSIYDDESLL